jgi:hypothetical protein
VTGRFAAGLFWATGGSVVLMRDAPDSDAPRPAPDAALAKAPFVACRRQSARGFRTGAALLCPNAAAIDEPLPHTRAAHRPWKRT